MSQPERPARPEGEHAPSLPFIDVNEYGGKRDGERQAMDRRLFMQLLVLDAPAGGHATDDLGEALALEMQKRRIAGVVYADTMSPNGLGLLTWSEDPAHFVRAVRPLFSDDRIGRLVVRPKWSMMGRTYATGHEPDLAFFLLERPIKNALEDAYAWHVWYPLRRSGAFARLDPAEQGAILREHAVIGHAYGQQELVHDIRLACHGLDEADNEFVIGLVARDLHRLSHLVQTMRKTRQTSEFIQQMGPFFVGHVVHRIRA